MNDTPPESQPDSQPETPADNLADNLAEPVVLGADYWERGGTEADYISPWVAEMGAAGLAEAVEVFTTDTSPLIAKARTVADGDVYFGLWLLKVDAASTVPIFSLEESWPWRAVYLEGVEPLAAAARAFYDHPQLGLLMDAVGIPAPSLKGRTPRPGSDLDNDLEGDLG